MTMKNSEILQQYQNNCTNPRSPISSQEGNNMIDFKLKNAKLMIENESFEAKLTYL